MSCEDGAEDANAMLSVRAESHPVSRKHDIIISIMETLTCAQLMGAPCLLIAQTRRQN